MIFLFTWFLTMAIPAPAAGAAPARPDQASLADVSIEDLMRLEVTSVSRRSQSMSRSAAAVYVITREDIRRSGASSIPEALRGAPGLFVARIDSSKWAISARGNAGRFANKMLVLIDGRSIYTTLYSGVYWDQNDVLLEDVERIEIVRGPGGTMWGANAVNGVVNIITRKAADTQGLMMSTRTGTEDRLMGAVRYGGSLGRNTRYRMFTKYTSRSGMRTPEGAAGRDSWWSGRGGGRLELAPSGKDTLTLHGDLYSGEAGEYVYAGFPLDLTKSAAIRTDQSGGYALGRWERALSDRSELGIQASVQVENRREAMGDIRTRQTDVDLQHRSSLGSRHDLLWGAGYRVSADRVGASDLSRRVQIDPAERSQSVYSAFVQDEIALRGEGLILTLGTKLQHNPFTGAEVQPGVRVLWTPRPRHALWGAVSRAVRTPSRAERDLRLDFEVSFPPGSKGQILGGGEAIRSETVLSHEAGWRWQPLRRLSLDIAGFTSSYRDTIIITTDPARPLAAGSPAVLLPIRFRNAVDFNTSGAEAAAAAQPWSRLHLHGSYSWLMKWDRTAAAVATVWDAEDKVPDHMLKLGASWDVTRRLRADVNLFRMPWMRTCFAPGGVRGDIALTVRFGESAQWSFGVQNALDDRRPEFVELDYIRALEAKRAFYTAVNWGR